MAAQRTLTECTDDSTEREDTPTTERELLDRAQAHAGDVAAEHFPSLPVEAIEWDISKRVQRTAGATKYNPENDEITISLTWGAYEQHGQKQFSATVRQELIHAWQFHEFGDADHGRTFERWTDAFDTSQYCERFTTPMWWVVCTDCGGRLARYQRSTVVTQPVKYSCGDCGGSLRVEEAADE